MDVGCLGREDEREKGERGEGRGGEKGRTDGTGLKHEFPDESVGRSLVEVTDVDGRFLQATTKPSVS